MKGRQMSLLVMLNEGLSEGLAARPDKAGNTTTIPKAALQADWQPHHLMGDDHHHVSMMDTADIPQQISRRHSELNDQHGYKKHTPVNKTVNGNNWETCITTPDSPSHFTTHTFCATHLL